MYNWRTSWFKAYRWSSEKTRIFFTSIVSKAILRNVYYDHIARITLCVPSDELTGLFSEEQLDSRWWPLMRQAGCMCHHMQIMVISISDITPSTRLFHNLPWVEDAIWQVLDGSRETEMNDILLSHELKCCILCREHLSDDHHQTLVLALVLSIMHARQWI